MEITKIYETASSDGYSTTGDRLYYADKVLAKSICVNKHGNFSVNPIEHLGIKSGENEYLLLRSETPIILANSVEAKEKNREIALAKLTQEEKELLNL